MDNSNFIQNIIVNFLIDENGLKKIYGRETLHFCYNTNINNDTLCYLSKSKNISLYWHPKLSDYYLYHLKHANSVVLKNNDSDLAYK